MQLSRLALCAWLAGTALLPPAAIAARATQETPAQKEARAHADSAAFRDFQERINAYVKLHKRIAKETPPLEQTNDAAQIKTAQETLSGKIRAARADAKPGDIFTPDIRARFRKLLRPELKGEDGRDAKRVLKDDAPESVPLRVNSPYPAGMSLPTVPITLLVNLPRLPEELEYRIIDRHLILRDTEANIIVDFVPYAIP